VVFVENFEEASLADLRSRWDDGANLSRLSFSPDRPSLSGGTKSLLMNGSSQLYRRLLPAGGGGGYDRLYYRYNVKFDPACSNIHHFIQSGGYNPPSAWPNPFGSSGQRPSGTDQLATGVEPMGTEWAWDFYTYWMHMRADGAGNFWGNDFAGVSAGGPSPHSIPKGVWLTVEFMVALNTPVSSYNGEQALWINGAKKIHLGMGFPLGNWVGGHFVPSTNGQPFEGFQWRSTTALKLNFLWLQLYVDADTNCKAWIDDVVVATEYVGPISAPGDVTPPSPPSNLIRTDRH
jgi:hypothetical protein